MSLCPVDHKACQCSGTAADPCPALEALRKDAGRYRWVRATRPDALLNVAWGHSKKACAIGADADAAIDAAINECPAVGAA